MPDFWIKLTQTKI